MIQLPSEEDVARVLEPQAWAALGCGDTLAYANRRKSSLRKARAVMALFAPVLAEKERRIRELVVMLDQQLGTPCEQIRHRQEADDLRAQIANLTERTRLPVIADYIEVQNHSRAMEARALAAESALAAERERCAKVVEGWAEEHAAHLADDAPSPIGRHRAAMNDGYALAAAIRAQGG